jgi:hypothetical protein
MFSLAALKETAKIAHKSPSLVAQDSVQKHFNVNTSVRSTQRVFCIYVRFVIYGDAASVH